MTKPTPYTILFGSASECQQKRDNLVHRNHSKYCTCYWHSKHVMFVRRCFKRIDTNNDRKIDYSEFTHALHAEGIFVDPEVERDCFNEIDTDLTGYIDFDEFVYALRVSTRVKCASYMYE